MGLVDCTLARHGDAILAILNEAILHSTALYEYAPRTAASMPAWFEARHSRGYPVLGLEDDTGQLLGFASYGVFRGFAAFRYTVEHSLYVHSTHRGRGVGEALLRALIERARQQGLHVLVGCLDAGNAASIALHRKLGFVPAGALTQAGFKFGHWLDLAFGQLTLETPVHPQDDTVPT